MSLPVDFIENCQGQKILIIEPFYTSPILETGLEVAELLSARNRVSYVGPEILRCITDETIKWRTRLRINLSRKRNVSKYLSNGVRKYSRSEIRALQRRLEVPDPRSFIDLADPGLASVTFEKFDVGMGLISSLVSITRDARVDLARYEDIAMALADDALMLYRLTAELIRTDGFDLVILFNGRQASVRGVRRACEFMNVRYIAHERGSSIEKYALFDCSTPHHPDGFRAWADSWWTKVSDPESNARAYLAKRRAGNPPEWYSFTGKQQTGYCPPRDGRKRVTFFTSSEDELVAVGDELRADTLLCDQAHSIRTIGLACRDRGHEYIVRFHPNTAPAELALFAAAREAGACIMEPASKVDTYALIDSSDIIFTHSSTVGLEAAAGGKPVFYVGRNYYEHCRSVRRLKSEWEIAEALDSPPASDPHDALKYANYLASHGIAYRHYVPRGFFAGTYRGVDLNGPLSALRDLKLRLTRGGV